jgi:hypothetical protein
MSQCFDASRSLAAFEQNNTLVVVIEMSHSKWLIASERLAVVIANHRSGSNGARSPISCVPNCRNLPPGDASADHPDDEFA